MEHPQANIDKKLQFMFSQAQKLVKICKKKKPKTKKIYFILTTKGILRLKDNTENVNLN